MKLKEKLKLLELVEYIMNVSAACKYMGVSRFTYYQIKKIYEKSGSAALVRKAMRVPNLKNRVSKKVEREILKLSFGDHTLGKKKMSEALKERGVAISLTGVRNVWVRHGLQTKEDRIKAAQEIFTSEKESI